MYNEVQDIMYLVNVYEVQDIMYLVNVYEVQDIMYLVNVYWGAGYLSIKYIWGAGLCI